jgi:DNA replication licensing factor MCM7
MEQQTVSIAKAGITTTLNARTAILAAANPRYGRYNRRADPDAHVALQKNINLPAALLSRFDLLFLLLDEVDPDNDKQLAGHVTYVHQNAAHPPLPQDAAPLSPAFIRQYVTIARHINPTVPAGLMDYVVRAYCDMRAKDKARAAATGGRSTLTARQLLSILRLSQALARLEMRLDIVQEDVDEAIRLVAVSKASVVESDAGERPIDGDYMSRLWGLLRDKAMADRTDHVAMVDAQQVAGAAGYGSRQLEQFLSEYEGLLLLAVNASRTRIDFVLLEE